mmetsp:Transcript_2090/g.3508  ORF Transcript_2090/g.3508 Transcript_2090/m.3508 type:complete len:86 (+) Transcript_2090:408-665(+)|eukprot:CAMPEP_0197727018 /NCGR_PEP_ID=MMETSP1434-20131217/18121_1 /TAXON_ID=265543 /ORGANISM="Minutocellus polymorphus, Strain CCMP3303" /LENGTH=85 /DNA_ID=CAMNT_0043313103 /DNA_START=406 /DNA_END=663 /DNA_ORIENTATION=+
MDKFIQADVDALEMMKRAELLESTVLLARKEKDARLLVSEASSLVNSGKAKEEEESFGPGWKSPSPETSTLQKVSTVLPASAPRS